MAEKSNKNGGSGHKPSQESSSGNKPEGGFIRSAKPSQDDPIKDKEDSEKKADDTETESQDSDDKSAGKKLKKASTVANIAGGAVKAGMAAHALNGLYAFFHMMAMLGKAALGSVAGLFSSIMATVMSVATAIGTAIGVSAVAVATVLVSGVAGVVVVTAVAIASYVTANNISVRDGGFVCDTDIVWDTQVQVDEDMVESAQKIYSVLSEYGLDNSNIAGVLGNWSVESGIDPTGVESIYDEPYSLGEKKLHAQSVDFKISIFNPSYSIRYPSINYCGIGLGQWTNDRNVALRNFANGVDTEWYDLDTQLAFMLGPDSRSSFFESWSVEANPTAAARTFSLSWEGHSYQDSRGEAAADWFYMMAEWDADVDYANSIIAMAGVEVQDATERASTRSLNGCSQALVANNSDLASAAVSMAWLSTSQSYNNGTYLYQCIKDKIFPGDPYYKSCDRTVATAVRWSGTDDNYPAGDVWEQMKYLATSPKWARVPWSGDPDALKPGDILICKSGSTSHTVMYVGNDVIQQINPGADSSLCIVHGSLDERSPACDSWSNSYTKYYVYRNIQKQNNSIYDDITCVEDEDDEI